MKRILNTLIVFILCLLLGTVLFNTLFSSETSYQRNEQTRIDEKVVDVAVTQPALAPLTKKEWSQPKPTESNITQQAELYESWCFAPKDLSEDAQIQLEMLLSNWHEQTGYAQVKDVSNQIQSEEFYPNNHWVAPYEDYSDEKLEELAKGDDIWAKVAYVQRFIIPTPDTQRDVALELIVKGASHFAFSYIVLKEVSAAKTAFGVDNDVSQYIEHLVNAIAFAMVGVDEHIFSGLDAYLAVTKGGMDFVEGAPQPAAIMQDIADLVRQRYSAITLDIARQRSEKNIQVMPPSKPVQQSFTVTTEITLNRYQEGLSDLATLGISNTNYLTPTPCHNRFKALQGD